MSGLASAEQAAQLIGPQIGVAPSVVLGQFYAEDGSSFSPSGSYNYGNLQPGGQEASYSSVGAFVSAFVQTIKDNFSAAENAGSNVAAYASALVPNSGPKYTTTTPEAQYAANIQAGVNQYGSQISGSTTTQSTGSTVSTPATPLQSLQTLGSMFTNYTGATPTQAANSSLLLGSTLADGASSVADAVTTPPTVSSFLGLGNLSFYDIAFIIVGIILVLGSIFFIAKPAVQSVAVNTRKVLA
jgi:hypothetical protein